MCATGSRPSPGTRLNCAELDISEPTGELQYSGLLGVLIGAPGEVRGFPTASTARARAAKRLAAGLATTCLTLWNLTITEPAAIRDSRTQRANLTGFGAMMKSPGSPTRAGSTVPTGCNTPGTGCATPTPTAGLKCPEAGPQAHRTLDGILPTIQAPPFPQDQAMERRFARFGRRTPRKLS